MKTCKDAAKEKRPLPVGVSDYVRAQAEYYYVDKTLLIKEFFRQKTAGFPVYQTEKIWKDIKYGYVTGVL